MKKDTGQYWEYRVTDQVETWDPLPATPGVYALGRALRRVTRKRSGRLHVKVLLLNPPIVWMSRN